MSVMFANSQRFVRESRSRKAWEQAELRPHNVQYSHLRNTFLRIRVFFPEQVGLAVEPQAVRPMEGGVFRSKASHLAWDHYLARYDRL